MNYDDSRMHIKSYHFLYHKISTAQEKRNEVHKNGIYKFTLQSPPLRSSPKKDAKFQGELDEKEHQTLEILLRRNFLGLGTLSTPCFLLHRWYA